jgi:hypothetical protein
VDLMRVKRSFTCRGKMIAYYNSTEIVVLVFPTNLATIEELFGFLSEFVCLCYVAII